MKEGTTLGARAQSAIQRAAVLYKPRLATFLTGGSFGNSLFFFNFLTALLCTTDSFTLIPDQEEVWRNEGRALRIYLSRHEEEIGCRLNAPDGLPSNKTASCQFGWG
jgi:hypothetical protein